MLFPTFLKFSDAAKFADIARNLVSGSGYRNSFTFWSNSIFNFLKQASFPALWTPPIMPFSIAVFFKIFGVNDFAVIATSFFYFVLLVFFTFLLGKKLFGRLVGILSALTVVANVNFIDYATTGATEPLFALEIVAATYFVSLKKRSLDIMAVIVAILMYFTRPQAFIYIAALVFYWLLLKFKTKKSFLLFGFVIVTGFLADYFILSRVAGRYFLYSVVTRGLGTVTDISAGGSASDALRGAITSSSGSGLVQVFKKVFYNLYNFYKLSPQIVNPYLFVLFIIGLFRLEKKKPENSLKISTIFVVLITFLVASASIPFFRYIHPTVPLIYIFAVETLVWIIGKIFDDRKLVIFVSTFLILFLAVGQTLGVFFLDSRFETNTHNIGQPPVYVVLSQILKENTQTNQVVVTNLDTWGSWYGERTTIWFPLEPKQLIDPATNKIPFDAIYLTSYLIDDENYYMGANWRMVFNNPEDPSKWICDGCKEITKEFKLMGTYKISASDNYERQDASAILLIKK